MNEECLVSASHQLALITSLPFVHTARRFYRLNAPVSSRGLVFGSALHPNAGNGRKPRRLEEEEVVTRLPLVNQRQDHYNIVKTTLTL